eukprot:SAG31_NODE_1332_length_8743_cov_20.800810_3_plen_60_part_00
MPAELEGHGPRSWSAVASKFGLMNDVRGGVARSSWHGIVQFRVRGVTRVFIVPRKMCNP